MPQRRTSTRPTTRTRARVAAATTAAGLLTLGLAAPASAHVTVTPSTTAAGAYAILTLSVPHGCDGRPTTKVAISVPEGINAVTPTRNPFYRVAKQTEQLDPPVTDAHGNEVTERVSVVTYTARSPLPDGYRDTMELSLQLPEDAAGETLAFPVIQTCTQGETAWTEVAASGDDTELDHPAPVVAVTEASDDDHHGASEDHDDAAEPADEVALDAASATEDEESSRASAESADGAEGAGGSDALAIGGLVAGLLGLLVGGVALARSGRRS